MDLRFTVKDDRPFISNNKTIYKIWHSRSLQLELVMFMLRLLRKYTFGEGVEDQIPCTWIQYVFLMSEKNGTTKRRREDTLEDFDTVLVPRLACALRVWGKGRT